MGRDLLTSTFQEKLDNQQKLFVPYIMAGDGGLNILEERITFLEECGASAIELGIPFSDPVADGPTIQEAGKRALENGTTLTNVLETLQDSCQRRFIPIILMTYINPIYTYGIEAFARDCVKSGVDGVIVPDLPLEEEALIVEHFQNHSIALIRLAALTSPEERLNKITERTEGFLYAVSVTGTTGARATHKDEVKEYLQNLKLMTKTPVLAGFGVSNSQQANDLGKYCDGVVVGSKIVDLFHNDKSEEIKKLIEESI
ncbi:tryptophan synthase subunit alpha [Virgibacillus byunsanensis]|uniref:Tryptophan synthase alpha chain n=1 Tax=Virgibacillus byunsanensis TaxID=570945 RepID=A0ABW3LLW1_9BACI